MKRILIPAALAVVLPLAGPALQASAAGTYQEGGGGGMTGDAHMGDRAAILVRGRPLMYVAPAGNYGAEQRANLVRDRIRAAVEPVGATPLAPITAQDVVVVTRNAQPVVQLRGIDILTVTTMDARGLGEPPQAVAERWAAGLRTALVDVRLSAGQTLPEDFVTVSVGGGAGMAPGHKDKKDMKAPMPPGGGGGMMPHPMEMSPSPGMMMPSSDPLQSPGDPNQLPDSEE